MTGGSADFGGRDQAIRTLGGAKTIADLEALEIPLGGGRRVTLSEIATVTDAWEKPKIASPASTTRPSCRSASSAARARATSTSTSRAEAAVAELQAAHPDVTISKVDNSVDYTEGNYDSAMETLLEGAGLSVHRRADLPARHPRHAGLGGRACRCRSSRPSGRST